MAQPADPIRRPAPVTPTSPIAASSSAAIGGSVWPTRSGSVPPVLDIQAADGAVADDVATATAIVSAQTPEARRRGIRVLRALYEP